MSWLALRLYVLDIFYFFQLSTQKLRFGVGTITQRIQLVEVPHIKGTINCKNKQKATHDVVRLS